MNFIGVSVECPRSSTKALYYGLLELKYPPLLCISWHCVSNGHCLVYSSSVIFDESYGVSPYARVDQYSLADSRITLADFWSSFSILFSFQFSSVQISGVEPLLSLLSVTSTYWECHILLCLPLFLPYSKLSSGTKLKNS